MESVGSEPDLGLNEAKDNASTVAALLYDFTFFTLQFFFLPSVWVCACACGYACVGMHVHVCERAHTCECV